MAFRDVINLFFGRWGRMRQYKAPFSDGRGYIIFTINTKPDRSAPVMQGIRIVDRQSMSDRGLSYTQGSVYFKSSISDLNTRAIVPITTVGVTVVEFSDVDISGSPPTVGWKKGTGRLFLAPGSGELLIAVVNFHTISGTKSSPGHLPVQMAIAAFNADVMKDPQTAFKFKESESFSTIRKGTF